MAHHPTQHANGPPPQDARYRYAVSKRTSQKHDTKDILLITDIPKDIRLCLALDSTKWSIFRNAETTLKSIVLHLHCMATTIIHHTQAQQQQRQWPAYNNSNEISDPYDRPYQPRHHAPGGQGEPTEQEHVYHQRQLQQTQAQQEQQPQQNFPTPVVKGPIEETSKTKTRGKGKPKTFFKVTDTLPSNGQESAENLQLSHMLPSASTLDTLHESDLTPREDRGSSKTPTARKGKVASVDSTTSDKHRAVKREESSGASSMSTPKILNEKTGTESLLFGSGMILVKKLPDASMSGGGQASGSNEPIRPFPPAQLSMRGGHGALGQSDTSLQPGNASDPPTPALKGKRSKASLNQDSEAASTETGSMSSPPPPPPPAARGKAANRARKGVSVSSDADIERSNQITRNAAGSTGPAWMTAALNSNSSTSTSAITNGIRRRPPLPQPQPSEADKRKPKRIKIEYRDDEQGQGSSSAVTGPGAISVDKKKKKDSKISDSASQPRQRDNVGKGQGEFDRDASGDSRKYVDNRLVEDGHERDHEDNLDDDETLEEDEVMEEGERDQSTADIAPGSLKRRSPEDEDDDYPDGDGSTVGGNTGRKQGSRRGRAAGTGVNGKSKSTSSHSGSVATNGAMDQGAVSLSKKATPSLSRTESASEGDQSKTNDAPTPASDDGDVSKIKGKKKAKKSKIEREDSETEIEYLPMEDDIRCPNMFGLEGLEYGLEKESSDNEGEDDEEDDDDDDGDAKSEQQGDGKVGSDPGSSKKGNKSASASATATPTDAEDPIHAQGRQWVKKLSMPEEAWVESFNTYERVKRLKELKNRQPVRKREAILAAILYIVCRNLGSPRTFSEICTASGVKRGDIGSYYRLMLKVLEPTANPNASARDTDAEAFMTRWCESLSLPPQVRPAAVHVFSQANTLNLTSGKCPSSVGAAAIYLCIYSWNDARRVAHCQKYQCPGCWRGIPSCSLASHNAAATLANGSAPVCTPTMASHDHPDAEADARWIRKEHKDVANAVGVVSATLMGCFKNLAPDRARLIPEEFLKVALEDE
ncbi:hypothetical protein BGZ81_011105 [Podila clonocystis]|nr:hypothetical protein BGZ81_011105 [Podila clonocystis]